MHASIPFRRCLFAWVVAVLVCATPRLAGADVTAAARAFAEGQAAQLEGNYSLAAERFELAFALQPAKEALRSAARMHMSARNFARAATHAQTLVDRFGEDGPSAELGRSILEEVAPRLALYEVACTPSCALSVNQRAYFVEPARKHRLYLNPGRVSLEAHFTSGRKESRSLTTAAGETAEVELTEPAQPKASPVADEPVPAQPSERRASEPTVSTAVQARGGLPPIVPWLTGAATLACGAAAVWAAVDTQRQHDAYVEHPTEQRWQDGVARQRLTNVLAASTAVLGAATITMAFFVRDSKEPSVAVSPALGPSAAAVALTGKF